MWKHFEGSRVNWKETIENALSTSYELPSIIASHFVFI